MKPPTVEEVRSYCSEKGYTFDPELFVAKNEARGWMYGKTPIKSWKAACVTWQAREAKMVAVGMTPPEMYADAHVPTEEEVIMWTADAETAMKKAGFSVPSRERTP